MSSRQEEPAGLGDFAGLRREAEQLRRRFDTGQSASATYEGHDPARAVRITVDGTGSVRKVEIDKTWQKTVGVEGLEPAVLQAVNDATTRRLTAWGKAVMDNEKKQRGSTAGSARVGSRATTTSYEEPTTGSQDETSASDPTRATARETADQIFSLLDGIEEELDRFERRVDELVNREVTGRSRGHHVTVTMSGGQVTRVGIDKRWLESAHEMRINDELREAFQSAGEAAGTSTAGTLAGDGNLGKPHAMASDPQELLKKLGLGGCGYLHCRRYDNIYWSRG